ncbi:DMP19 family protein [Flammeovirga aprica]|uniref:DMP19 family protein n=1 Tax=Flammeovirga aprica JL-4 TaxID=694437 RepID=A0A7X9P3R5_9BACT|nr:DUF4375 domain-containing protein [Flammeovirga aprica]NME68219.1 DMP19 family protein [Flammeovirga aprica JL-4]
MKLFTLLKSYLSIKKASSTPIFEESPDQKASIYWKFDETNPFIPNLEKEQFESLTGMDFGWYVLEPLSLYVDHSKYEEERCVRFNYAQKFIYFWWYLDAQVSNGGFVQFFINGYGKYLDPIKRGLMHIGATEQYQLLVLAERYFKKNDESALKEIKVDEQYQFLVDQEILTPFCAKYLEIGRGALDFFKEYALKHPDELASFKTETAK